MKSLIAVLLLSVLSQQAFAYGSGLNPNGTPCNSRAAENYIWETKLGPNIATFARVQSKFTQDQRNQLKGLFNKLGKIWPSTSIIDGNPIKHGRLTLKRFSKFSNKAAFRSNLTPKRSQISESLTMLSCKWSKINYAN